MAYLERKSTRLRADLNEMLDHMGLVTCTQHPSKCSRMHTFFFSSAHGTLPRIEQMVGFKSHLI